MLGLQGLWPFLKRQENCKAFALGNGLNTCPGGITQGRLRPSITHREAGRRGRSTQHPDTPLGPWCLQVTRSSHGGPDTSPLSLSAASAFSGQKHPEDECVGIPRALATGLWGFQALFSFFFSPHCNCTQGRARPWLGFIYGP